MEYRKQKVNPEDYDFPIFDKNNQYIDLAAIINEKVDNDEYTDDLKSYIGNLKYAYEQTLQSWLTSIDEDDLEDMDEDEREEAMAENHRDWLDIEYRINHNGEYNSVQVTVSTGGPNCYIDTKDKNFHLYTWGDHYYVPLTKEVCDGLDEYFEEMYTCTKGDF